MENKHKFGRSLTATVALTIVLALYCIAKNERASDTDILHKTVQFTANGVSPREAIVRLGVQERIPLGIVVSDPQSKFCKDRISVEAKDETTEKIAGNILAGTGYTWSDAGGVLWLKPASTTSAGTTILSFSFDEFKSIATTMHGLGIILSGYVENRLHPDKGYAGSILSSTNSEVVHPFVLTNATVTQIANHIVLSGGKGIWFVDASNLPPEQDVRRIQIYSYSDDGESLAAVPCTGWPN
jgi:hypothetical protein